MVKRYQVYRSENFQVSREGVLLIIKRDDGEEETLQGQEGYDLETAIEASEFGGVGPEKIDHLIDAYF